MGFLRTSLLKIVKIGRFDLLSCQLAWHSWCPYSYTVLPGKKRQTHPPSSSKQSFEQASPWAMPETPWESDGGFGSARPGTALTVEQRGPFSAVFGPTQAMGIDADREGSEARGMSDVVTLKRSSCNWHKEVAVCEGSLFVHPFLLISPHFDSSGKMHAQGWNGWATLAHHRKQEHPAGMLGIIWVHAWSSPFLPLLSLLPTGV